MNGAANQANIGAIFGASASGKSSLQKLELLEVRPPRVLIWDPKREYGAFAKAIAEPAALRKAALAGGPFALRWEPRGGRDKMRRQFDLWCRIAVAAGTCWAIADELADVTEPGWAPEGWEILTRQGRHHGLTVRGLSQRPAEIDKTFYGNATHVAVFRMNAEGDVDRMAKLLGVERRTVLDLRQLEWLERNMLTGELSEKKLLTPADLARLP
jgi:hypothetical protein